MKAYRALEVTTLVLWSMEVFAVGPCDTGLSWYMVKKPAKGESSVYLVLNAPSPVMVRVCYCTGPDDSYVWARASSGAGKVAGTNAHLFPEHPEVLTRDFALSGTWVSQLYKSGCAVVAGTMIWLANYNEVPVQGTYELIPQARSE